MDKQQLQDGAYVEKRFSAASDDIEVKEDGKGRKRVRMPISSTAEDRDGDEFSQEGLENERDQINEGKVPAFLDHGRGSRGGYYGALGIVGTWDNATIETERDGDIAVDVLYADFVPTEANEDAQDIVALLEDDMPVGASVGFRVIDYERDRDEDKLVFNSVDLLETSIVGIPSNPLTVNDGGDVGTIGAKALGSPDVPMATQRGYGAHQANQQASAPALGDLETRLDDLEKRLDGSPAESEDSPDTDSPTDPDSERDTDPDDTMSDDIPEGGDDPANDNDDLAELRDTVEQQTETQEQLANSIDDLVKTIASKEDDEGDEAENEEEDEDEDKSAGGDSDPAEDEGEETVQLFVGDDADEDTRKEFEALREKANDNGGIDLADSETKLFGSDDDNDEDDTSEVMI